MQHRTPAPAPLSVIAAALLLTTGCSLTDSTEGLEGVWEASWTSSRIEVIDPTRNILTLEVGPDGVAEAGGLYRYTNPAEENAEQRLELLVMMDSDGNLSGAGWWFLQILPYGRNVRETVSVSGHLDRESYAGEMVVAFTTGLSDVELTFPMARVR